ncbi:hypothetical protein [Cryobacterium sp. PAMC25264]|uniref:hypothetical protein n=1 Tax=Cryobacterium sp. PAMC25264 TaxID=2861288 RepID=UPI001C62F9AA|nr:hypothetical protein [Cryobacterium sp. PAMC25264]QYF75034.1 hypothetical protein KY500_08020 [Cryobacterium sp. PAMC25264]
MGVLIEVLAALGTIVLVSTLTVVLIGRTVYTRMRRSRAVNRGLLRTRATLSVGPQHEILAQRVRLRDSLYSGHAAVDIAGRSAGPHGDLKRLFRRIESEAQTVDAHLLLLSSETEPEVLRGALPLAVHRVDQVTGLVRTVRAAVAAGLGGFSDDALLTLQLEVDREIAALDAGMAQLHTLNHPDAQPPSRPSPYLDTHLDRGTHS